MVPRNHAIGLPLLVSTRFQVLFHSPSRGTFHLSLTVLVRYRSTKVFSLGGWTPQLPTGLACPVVLRIPACSPSHCAYRTLTLYRWPFQNHSAQPGSHYAGPTTPTAVAAGLGFSTFARHYSRNC